MLIAIDPGASGGIVWTQLDTVHAIKMPDTDTAIVQHLRNLHDMTAAGVETRCVMEKVGGYIGGREVEKVLNCPHCHRGVAYVQREAEPASRMFDFGEGVGLLKGTVLTLGFRLETVPPRTWQTAVGMSKGKGESKTSWKNRLKDQAQKFFPAVKVTLSTADALLILEYARRVRAKPERPVLEIPGDLPF